MNPSKIFACLALLPVAACARTSGPVEARNPPSATPYENREPSRGAYASSPAEAELPAPPPSQARGGSTDGASAAAPRAALPGSAYQPPAEKKADNRPGLGTTWGETRQSYVSSAPFERADSSRPFALVTLNYNDDAGIQAMARRMGNSYASFDRNGVEVEQGALSVNLLDENGMPLPSTDFGGRDYVAGSDGQRYVIQIENHTGNRFEAVATVDGLDVIDGKEGSVSKRGYLVNPWATLQIDGFRRSRSAVAAFRFGAVKDSYAARKGNDRNVGVIGVAFFHERGSVLPWTERELERRESADPFPGGFASPPPMR
ncbi:MAG TPA: hypothetical protein VFK05_34965 [Polyangiaceae bacterium]|nr:hypothetical protein [Polyangiaceae bacterium]